MKILGLLFFTLTMFFALTSEAYVVPTYRDLKPATQYMVEHQVISAPIVATTNYIKTTYAGPTSAAALTLSSFTHQPDVPRNITITPTGTTGDVESCVITISGTNFLDVAITDTVTFAADATTVQATTKAFKTVSSVAWAASCESGGFAATWVIGVGEVFGLKACMDKLGFVLGSVFDGAWEGTRPTCLADATHIESNTCDFNGTPNAAKDIDVFFFQNFRCHP